ncbi:MAG: MATE family efflux transporter [Muribaculaceae bacterium]|nr:MATE family efflux transporter [Muribaculaceae bacterium]
MYRKILHIAIPSIIANITTPLLSMVDLAIVGHMGNASFIAAIALGGTIFSMIYWLFGFLRMGTSGMTAQAVGADDRGERDASLWRAMIVALSFGLLIIALQSYLKSVLFRFMGGEVDATNLARTYFDVLIFGAPATLGVYVLNGWFIGLQNARLTMWLSLIVNIVNICCSLLLVYVFQFGIEGVAAGTLIAQWTGFIVGLLMVVSYRPRFEKFKSLFNPAAIRRFFAVNTDIFLRTLCLVAVTVWFTRAGARQGDIILAVNALLMQLFILFSYIMDGFAFAGEALAGLYVGSGETDKRLLSIKSLFKFGVVIATLFTLCYFVAGDTILAFLSDDRQVLIASEEYSWWALAIPFAGMAAFIWDGVFIGETRTRGMLVAMLVASILFFGAYYLLFPIWENHALWFAFILYLAMRGVVQTLIYIRR